MEFQKINLILGYSLISFLLTFILFPFYINILKKIKIWKNIREEDISGKKASIFQKLHWHKKWTPTMWWALILMVVWILIIFSIFIQKLWITKFSLLNQKETYILIFSFFLLWILWLIDDILNIKWIWKIKWLTAKMKLFWMFWFSAFISYWFYIKLWISYINLWPFWKFDIWIFYFLFTLILTVAIINAVNITDGLDWLVSWLGLIVLFSLGIMTFIYKWYLATTLIWIIIWAYVWFLWYNINPAKIFLWDSWSLALGWFISSLIYLLNIKMWIWIPFTILFLLFFIELLSSFIQIISKKFFWKKVFPIAPFHHTLEYYWMNETTIVMKFWLIQACLAALSLILMLYQL